VTVSVPVCRPLTDWPGPFGRRGLSEAAERLARACVTDTRVGQFGLGQRGHASR